MQKTVKIISLTASNFGVLKALELDFDKFKEGFIAIKGNAGAGKTTVQNALKTGVQGRATLSDAAQYGDEWEVETQLIDGDRKIFVGAKKAKDNATISYQLYEKDTEGKRVLSPVIDGLKATPSKYMELISTELTFGIKDFLSENKTVHRNFMFSLFRPELEKLGVVFDKKNPEYEKTILGRLDALTETRDGLRSQCQHSGAYVTDFEREGYTLDSLDLLKRKNVDELTKKHSELLVEKGAMSGNANAGIEIKKAEIAKKGAAIIEQIRQVSRGLLSKYEIEKKKYDEAIMGYDLENSIVSNIINDLKNVSFLKKCDNDKIFGLKRDVNTFCSGLSDGLKDFYKINNLKAPEPCFAPAIVDNQLKLDTDIKYHSDFNKLFEQHRAAVSEYMAILPEPVNYEAMDKKIEALNIEIDAAKGNNTLIDRYELNREWVEADAKLNKERQELAKLYAKVDTGVNGLYMKPFFNDEKMEIKTVYNGVYDAEFFHNKGEERLLLSYSSTQRPIIGILLQVARLKRKTKALPYIFIDDVPMDLKSREIITKIAKENNLTIITSMTGDYDKTKLTENELLIEGGEVFFNE